MTAHANIPQDTPAWKIWTKWLLRIAGLFLAVWMIRRLLTPMAERDGLSSFQAMRNLFAGTEAHLVAIAFAVYGFVQVLGAWRWRVLLQMQGISVSGWDVFRLTLIGGFFNTVLVGAVTGDLIKMGFILEHAPQKRPEAAFTLVLDRYFGLFGLLLVAMATSLAMMALQPTLLQNRIVLLATVLVWAIGTTLASFAFLAVWRKRLQRLAPAAVLLRKARAVLPAKATILLTRLVHTVDNCRQAPHACSKVLLLCAIIHLCLGGEAFLLGRAFHETTMSLLQYRVATPMGNASSILPLTPGGIGIRDAVTAALFQAFQANPIDTAYLIPLAYTAIFIAWGLLGGLCLFLPASSNGTKNHTTTAP